MNKLPLRETFLYGGLFNESYIYIYIYIVYMYIYIYICIYIHIYTYITLHFTEFDESGNGDYKNDEARTGDLG